MKILIQQLIERLVALCFFVIGLFPKKEVVYFESMHGRQYSDNPRAIYEQLVSLNTERKSVSSQSLVNDKSDFELIWGVKKGFESDFVDAEVPYMTRFSLRWFLLMPRARVWVINTRTPLWLVKSKDTIYIQTWHGTPLKKIGIDVRSDNKPSAYEKYSRDFVKESARWNYLLAPNPYSKEIFKEAFQYSGKMICCGYPRNDILINEKNNADLKRKIKENIGLLDQDEREIVLYCPTWRDNNQINSNRYRFDEGIDFRKWEKELVKNTVLLVRGHYLTDYKGESDGNIINVSNYEDVNQLLLIADILITDYSSVMFDYSLLDRPVILYVPDRNEYVYRTRGIYFDIFTENKQLVAESKMDLESKLKAILMKNATMSMLKTDNIANWEKGIASQKVAELILGNLKMTNEKKGENENAQDNPRSSRTNRSENW
ncbi:CDP-glycerol glycerophosphotransferase family protein [Bavariicoccus seileri]|nr:CDP-glycerol glycerophosphotransferase family protein [Bavariicoccus seileri]